MIYKSYYTVDEFNELERTHNELTIISLNINSLRKYCEDLEIFINSLKCKPDVIILQETRCNIDPLLNQHFKEYKHYVNYPEHNKCGGVVLLVKNTINEKINNKL